MKSQKFLVAAFSLFLLSGNVLAGLDDLCICQTGSEPREQVPAFFAGCEAWLNLQMCVRKKIVSISKPLIDVVDKGMKPRSIKVGYVGHWGSAEESVQYLSSEILPVIKKYDVSIKVDNTACLAVDNPYVIMDYLNSITEGPRIRFLGNQAISTGMWDKFLPGRNNFWAKIDGKKKEVTFPSCKSFEKKICFGMFQGGEKGICHDTKTDGHAFLECAGKEDELIEQKVTDTLKGGGVGVLKKLDHWKRMDIKFTKNKSFYNDGKINVVDQVTYSQNLFETEEAAVVFMEKAKHDVRLLLRK